MMSPSKKLGKWERRFFANSLAPGRELRGSGTVLCFPRPLGTHGSLGAAEWLFLAAAAPGSLGHRRGLPEQMLS